MGYRVQVQGLRGRGIWSLLSVNDNSRAERNAEIVLESLLLTSKFHQVGLNEGIQISIHYGINI